MITPSQRFFSPLPVYCAFVLLPSFTIQFHSKANFVGWKCGTDALTSVLEAFKGQFVILINKTCISKLERKCTAWLPNCIVEAWKSPENFPTFRRRRRWGRRRLPLRRCRNLSLGVVTNLRRPPSRRRMTLWSSNYLLGANIAQRSVRGWCTVQLSVNMFSSQNSRLRIGYG